MASEAEQRQLTFRITPSESAELRRQGAGVKFSYPGYRGYELAPETAASFFFSCAVRRKMGHAQPPSE